MKRAAEAEDEVSKRMKIEGDEIPVDDVDEVDHYVTQEVIEPEVTTIIEQNDIHVTDGSEVVSIETGESQILHIQNEGEIVETEGEVVTTTEGEVFDTIHEEDISQADDATLEQVLQPAPQFQNIIVQHMNIAAPLSTLQKLLETRLQCSLADHEFWLQDTHKLDPSKNLVSQCVQGSGMVQINVEVKSQPGIKPRLNIVDILKPAEEVVEMPVETVQTVVPAQQTTTPTKVVIPFPEESENVTRWIVDQSFRREQERLKIPLDPAQWNEAHVRHWIQWAVKEFTLDNVDIENFKLTGTQLCELRHEEFTKYIPNDKGDIFWTHLELLRKCKFVAVIQQPTPHAITTITVSTSGEFTRPEKSFSRQKNRPFMLSTERVSPGNRTGNNGQIQLWQFLLELLTDKDCREVIQWVGDDGEFKLNNPEVVAQMWGQRKNKPTMNYEKLSRALRYYYDGDMIAKVHGKRFVYKFVCDLRMLLGYNAGELNRLVTECAEKKLQRMRLGETLKPAILKRCIEVEAK